MVLITFHSVYKPMQDLSDLFKQMPILYNVLSKYLVTGNNYISLHKGIDKISRLIFPPKPKAFTNKKQVVCLQAVPNIFSSTSIICLDTGKYLWSRVFLISMHLYLVNRPKKYEYFLLSELGFHLLSNRFIVFICL